MTNWLLAASGCFQRFGHSKLERVLIRDRKALKKAVEHILSWDFERISVGHGPTIEENAREIFKEGLEREIQGQ